jgi:nucleotide-binding universal stress UspA family protein
MFDSIAVPLDGSQFGEIALPWARRFGAAFGSAVHLISVSEHISEEDRGLRQGYLDDRAQSLRSQILRANPDAAGSVLPVVLAGDPARQIVQYTETNSISLVILVSHGRSGILSWPMGSTATRILSAETGPVLFLRASSTAMKPARGAAGNTAGILVALDGSMAAEAVLPYATEISVRLEESVTLLRTVPGSYDVPTIGGMKTVDLPPREIDRLRREAGEYLDNAKTRFNQARAVPAVRTGAAAEEIMGYATENDMSMIAITSRGQSHTSGWKFGAVAHKIANTATVPVFIVRTPP